VAYFDHREGASHLSDFVEPEFIANRFELLVGAMTWRTLDISSQADNRGHTMAPRPIISNDSNARLLGQARNANSAPVAKLTNT
jgi:hypothetical protein